MTPTDDLNDLIEHATWIELVDWVTSTTVIDEHLRTAIFDHIASEVEGYSRGDLLEWMLDITLNGTRGINEWSRDELEKEVVSLVRESCEDEEGTWTPEAPATGDGRLRILGLPVEDVDASDDGPDPDGAYFRDLDKKE